MEERPKYRDTVEKMAAFCNDWNIVTKLVKLNAAKRGKKLSDIDIVCKGR